MKGFRYYLLLAISVISSSVWAASEQKPTVLITGASRGLGYEFARQYKADGYHVIATARKPDKSDALTKLGVKVYQLDVTSQASVDALAKELKNKPIDILINNAGINVDHQKLSDLDLEQMKYVFEVNSIGPVRVTQALLPNLMAGKEKKVINISSQLGSIENNTGTYTHSYRYSYRASKAALNQLNRSMANEFGKDGFICVALHPGWVRTDMGGPMAKYSTRQSIEFMIKVISGLTSKDNGKFLNLDGSRLPW